MADHAMRRFCNTCGAEVAVNDVFCWHCGSRLSLSAGSSPDDDSSVPAGGQARPEPVRLDRTIVAPRAIRLRNVSPRAVPPAAKPAATPTPAPTPVPQEPLVAVLPPSAFDEPVDLEPSPVRTAPVRASLLRRRTGERLALDLPCVVGRGSRATCRVEGNDAISREHVRIAAEGDGYVLRNLSSTNATYVDGRRVGSGESAELRSGSAVSLADEEFTFLVGNEREQR